MVLFYVNNIAVNLSFVIKNFINMKKIGQKNIQ